MVSSLIQALSRSFSYTNGKGFFLFFMFKKPQVKLRATKRQNVGKKQEILSLAECGKPNFTKV